LTRWTSSRGELYDKFIEIRRFYFGFFSRRA
jgi:hypothetical protein